MWRGAVIAAGLGLAGCGSSSRHEDAAPPDPVETRAALAPGEFPASLAPFGQGYPAKCDPCRRLGESEATANWLDDQSVLVGCPTKEAAEKLGGTIVETVDGILLVSVPEKPRDEGDALVPGSGFHATAKVGCAGEDGAPLQPCDAGVKREWGADGTTLVEVTKPDGAHRAIFFRDGEAFGADGTQADGSADWRFSVTRDGRDNSVIAFGPERYVIPDAFVVGG